MSATKNNKKQNRKEMRCYMRYIESAGFNVTMLGDGSLQVEDPYMLNGKPNAGHEIVILKNERAVNRFIIDRS